MAMAPGTGRRHTGALDDPGSRHRTGRGGCASRGAARQGSRGRLRVRWPGGRRAARAPVLPATDRRSVLATRCDSPPLPILSARWPTAAYETSMKAVSPSTSVPPSTASECQSPQPTSPHTRSWLKRRSWRRPRRSAWPRHRQTPRAISADHPVGDRRHRVAGDRGRQRNAREALRVRRSPTPAGVGRPAEHEGRRPRRSAAGSNRGRRGPPAHRGSESHDDPAGGQAFWRHGGDHGYGERRNLSVIDAIAVSLVRISVAGSPHRNRPAQPWFVLQLGPHITELPSARTTTSTHVDASACRIP